MLHRVLSLTLLLSALPTTLAAAGIPIAGKVVTPDGDPAAKAEVRLERILPAYQRAVLRLDGHAGPASVAETRAGADGTFELAAPEAGMWQVVVSAPGMLTVERRLVPIIDAIVLTPVRLTPAADLEVRLVDAEGKPRPGRVGALALDVRGPWRPRLRLADAGDDGVARLPLGKGEKIQLEALADGHPLAVFELYDETSVTLDMPAGVAGTVRVTDRQRRPLAAAVAFQGSALLPLGLSDAEGRMPLVLQAGPPEGGHEQRRRPEVKVVTADRSHGSFDLDFGRAGRAAGKVEDLRLDPPTIVRGQVLDLSSRDPVAGALVWAVRGELTITDQHGQYALAAGVYRSRSVWAAAAGYTTGYSRLADAAAEDAPAIGLTPAAALAGKVKDTGGALLEGVEVMLEVLPHQGRMPRAVSRVMGEGWRGQTSERGAFRVPGLPAGVGYRLTVTAEGFAPRTLEVAPLEPFEDRDDLEVTLEPGQLAFGRVVDEDEVPVAGAEVVLRAPPPSDDPMTMMRIMRRRGEATDESSQLTGAEGRFEIADLAPGSYDLEVSAAGFAPAKVPGVRVVESEPRTDFGTVVLIPGARIEGRVVTEDAAAIAGAEVAVEQEQQGFMRFGRVDEEQDKVESDARGRFVIDDLLPDRPLTVIVSKEGFGTELVSGVRPPTAEPLAIELRPSGRLAGRVVDSLGDPVEGARVHALPDHRAMMSTGRLRRSGSNRRSWAATDAEGRFAIDDVEPGILQVSVDAEGYKRQERTGVELAAGAELELDFTLETGAVVEGTVTTADGEPVAEAWVNVSEQQEGFFPGRGPSASGQSGADGRYRVTGAPVGPATINVFQTAGGDVVKHVEIKPGTNVVDLVLERGFDVSGQVVAQDGSPVGGAQVQVEEVVQPTMGFRYSGGSPQAVSAADGTFTVEGVTAGKYKVAASRTGYAQASTEPFEVSADVTGLLLEMGSGTTLKGRVLGLDFDELGSLTLFAVGGGGMRQGRVDFAGEYAVGGLAPGQWHVQAQVAASGRTATLQIEVAEGVAEVVEDIEFGSGFTLTGIVLDGGEPLADAHVNVSGAGGSNGSTTGGDGRFRIEGLKAGSHVVMVMAGMNVQHSQALELAGDQELHIEIATGSISGRVLDATGEPLAGVALALEPLDAAAATPWPRFSFGNQVQTDSSGRFLVARVRQGTWRVVATKSGYAPGEATVAVAGGTAPGAAPEIEIRMTPTEGVTFEVVLASGIPVQGVQVALLGPDGRRMAEGFHSAVEGKVRVSTVPPGRWELVVQGGESAATRFAVNAPGDQGRLVLPLGGSLQLHVPELESVMLASVSLTGPDGKPFVATGAVAFAPGEWMLNAGRTVVPALTPGVWSFTVRHEDRTWSGSATVTPGQTTEVTVP